ncbi:MDR family MFS transporter [Amycolatopsis sp. A133]|uniref:MDR family MFS transporter n=1 Tax=Amycolatopsis sp. A133 TaxID=3064472 RepID=UPI0027F8BE4B|nr:MDR family MFS transporter [Amycolatopsis sp. A133]MDQ7809496.1 MDR family MFS transporter [Amycolatopsis sp. A133]
MSIEVPLGPAVRPAMTALVLAVLLAALDQTIVATALPRIAGDLGGFRDIAWITASYLLASTAATPLWGKLGDMLGRKRLYLVATTAFLVASALCGLAQDLPQLIAARALQGLAGGGMIVLTFALVGDIAEPAERGRYQGRFGSVYGVAGIAGPLLGGLFTDHLSWRWAFLINVPVGLVALVLAARALPVTVRSPQRARIDYAGALLLAGAATALVLITSFGPRWGWTSPGTLALAATALVLIGLVVPVERRAAAPVLPPAMFASRTVVITALVGFIANVAMFSALIYLPTYLQVVDGVSATLSGVHLLPLVLGLVVSQSLAGRWVANPARLRVVLVTGMAVNVAGLLLLSTLAPGTAQLALIACFAVMGIGIGMVPMVALTAAQNAVAQSDIGAASAVVTFARSIGAAFGVAVFGSLLGEDVAGHIGGAFLAITPAVVLGTVLATLLKRPAQPRSAKAANIPGS